jgi:hypothetical protein
MYRYSVDNAITYTSEDLFLFKESPFASFMERLTLENPHHGIPPDVGSEPPHDTRERQDEIAETLIAEGREVALIDWEASEPERRSATLQAMRKGVDFIVNAQLALGPLSGSANLLMRTSGFSELGDYLYVPCDTQSKTTMQSAFRLCFLADLLHSLQGQLPPQMLIIRGGSDVLPLQTEDHIYHFMAVKQRFMTAQREFRKHRMPDPAESAHFGRWSDCANEVLKQRALGEPDPTPLTDDSAGPDDSQDLPELKQAVVGGDTVAVATQPAAPETGSQRPPDPGRFQKGLRVSGTLAEQARALSPSVTERSPADSSAPQATPDRVGHGTEIPPLSQAEFATLDAMPTPIEPVTGRLPPVGSSGAPGIRDTGTDALLDDLAFVRSRARRPSPEPGDVPGDSGEPKARQPSGVVAGTVGAPGGVERRRPRKAPPPTLGDLDGPGAAAASTAEFTERRGEVDGTGPAPSEPPPHPLDTPGFNVNRSSMVDRDEAPPAPKPSGPVPKFSGYHDELAGEAGDAEAPEDDWLKNVPPFDSSLITNRDLDD